MIDNYYNYYYFYVVITFVNLTLLVFINFIKKENKKFLFSLLIVLLQAILIGIRAKNIGIDSHQYAAIFSGSYNREGIEPLFLVIKFLLNWITTDYSIFFVFMATVINLFIFFAFKNLTKDYAIAFAIFLSTFLFINMQINIMRQALAISIVFYAISCLIMKENRKFWIFVLIATSAHYTAILFSILYFLRNVELNKKRIIYFILMLIPLYNITLSDIIFLIKDYNPYLDRVYWYFHWGLLTPWKIKHIYYLVLILIGYLFLHVDKLDNKDKTLFIFYLYGIVMVLLFQEEEMVADRFFYYFILIGIILILTVKKFIKQKKLFIIILYLALVIWFIKTTYIQFPAWFIPPFEAIRTA